MSLGMMVRVGFTDVSDPPSYPTVMGIFHVFKCRHTLSPMLDFTAHHFSCMPLFYMSKLVSDANDAAMSLSSFFVICKDTYICVIEVCLDKVSH